jgi:hypothetical protein
MTKCTCMQSLVYEASDRARARKVMSRRAVNHAPSNVRTERLRYSFHGPPDHFHVFEPHYSAPIYPLASTL